MHVMWVTYKKQIIVRTINSSVIYQLNKGYIYLFILKWFRLTGEKTGCPLSPAITYYVRWEMTMADLLFELIGF